MTPAVAGLYDYVRKVVSANADALIALSHRIHRQPELGFAEHQAVCWLTELLAAHGMATSTGAGGLETAFVATGGAGPLTVAICAEYDALPGIGHACGHNVIAAAAAGAGLALAVVGADAGLRVEVIGTPAEEGGGGKITLLEAGVFDGVHAALMIHPGGKDLPAMPTLATTVLDAAYSGTAAHASAYPERGINAADAVTVAQVALGLLRQHIRPTDRLHGIVTDGGSVPQVVPDHAALRYQVRAATTADLVSIETRVRSCLQAGALAAGATLQVTRAMPVYAELRVDRDLTTAFGNNVTTLGRNVSQLTPRALRAAGSTDMGNVSHVIPSIHPMLGIGSLPAVPHQAEFAAAAAGADADRAVLDGAVALAWTALDAATDPELRERLMAREPGPPNGHLSAEGSTPAT